MSVKNPNKNGNDMQNELQPIDTLEAESNDLAIHVNLCTLRYSQIVHTLNSMDKKITRIEQNVSELTTAIQEGKLDKTKDYLKVMIYLVGALMTIAGFLLAKFVV